MARSDVIFNRKNLTKLLFLGLVGGFFSGALGRGGGTIFNPILLGMGVPPKVSSATAMYMIIFSTATSTSLFFIHGVINMEFALWLGLWSSIGCILGLAVVG